eukprot:g3888.t1
MIDAGMVDKMICSFPRSSDPRAFTDKYLAFEIELELVPQGTLAERIRAGGAGIPAFYTPTAFGTELAEGKPTAEFDGRMYVQERWLKADFALIKAELADPHGNLTYSKAARNFNPLMCAAAKRTIVQIAWRVAQDIEGGSYVNLGIGFPELVANYLPADRQAILHTENGILGFGPAPSPGKEDWDLINAGKKAVTLNPGSSFFHHADSFAMVRGGHLDVAILGAYQIAENGDLANWRVGSKGVPAVGGAMDLVHGAKQRNPSVDWDAVDDVILGCANQAGEDNRNVARMAVLLSGLRATVTGTTINRLCGSGMDAVIAAARAIKAGEADLILAGGVESMSRAPFVLPKAETAYSRNAEIHDTTIGWRFVNPTMKKLYGVDSMPETGDNVAIAYRVTRGDQDAFAYRSQTRAAAAQACGRLAKEIRPVTIPQRKGDPIVVSVDEHPRATTMESLSRLTAVNRMEGATVTAGNASGVNDGSAALIVASEAAVRRHGLSPLARVLGGATAGVAPRVMGVGPVPATLRLCQRLGMTPQDFDLVELNEAFASQSIAVLRELGLAEDADYVNPNGGGIALGHPLGMSGARIVGTAALELSLSQKHRALATMCVGVGQGIAVALERA